MKRPSLKDVRQKQRDLRNAIMLINRKAPDAWNTMPDVKDQMMVVLGTMDWILDGRTHVEEAINNVIAAGKEAKQL